MWELCLSDRGRRKAIQLRGLIRHTVFEFFKDYVPGSLTLEVSHGLNHRFDWVQTTSAVKEIFAADFSPYDLNTLNIFKHLSTSAAEELTVFLSWGECGNEESLRSNVIFLF